MNPLASRLAHQALSRSVSLRLLCLLVSFPFWMSGLAKIFDWNNTLSRMTRVHLSPPTPFVVATILVELLGSAMLIVGPYKWFGAIALSSFTALTIPIAHNFWSQVGTEHMISVEFAMEHMAVIGGLLAVARLAAVSRGPGAGE